jgi:PAS domain S-box-containing protein
MVDSFPHAMWLTGHGRVILANEAAVRLSDAVDLLGGEFPCPVVQWPADASGSIRVFQAVPTSIDSLFASSVECVHILDTHGRVLSANSAAHDSLDAGARADWKSLWTASAVAAGAVQKALHDGASRFEGLSGNHWWDTVITPLCGATGQVDRLLCVSRDITELKQSQLVESLERDILESVTSTRPIVETLNAICGLAEFACGGGGKCSILSIDGGQEGDSLRVISAPSISGLPGLRILKSAIEQGGSSLDTYLRMAEAGSCIAVPLGRPGGATIGTLAFWLGASAKASEGLRAKLVTSAALASVAMNRDLQLRGIRGKHEHLAAVSKAAPVGLYQCDAQGLFIFANERHAQLTGLPMHLCNGDGWVQSVHAEDRELVLSMWREARATKSEFRAEYRLRGEVPKWVVVQESPVGAEGFVGTVTDITELKRALAAVADGAERFETLANNMSQLCWMADANGAIFWYNERWYQYTGTTLETMRGPERRAVLHPDHMDRVAGKIVKHFQSGEVWEDTFPLRGKDGAYRWFLSRAVPIRDEAGNITRWFGTNTDITEQRQLEGALHRQNLALKRSNEDLSRFAFVASHDLQEPLRMVSSYAQLARRSAGASLDEKSRVYLDSIVESASRMSQLIQDLLAYAQISSDSDQEPARLDLGELAAAVIASLGASIAESGAVVTYESLPAVRGIGNQISRVLQNLISNSLKYRRTGIAPVIEISAEPDGALWRILVRDNGQGFDPEHAARIFGFLERLHGRDVPGSGMGLAICKSIVERNGGSMGAEGRPGEGSTFWFTLPPSAV